MAAVLAPFAYRKPGAMFLSLVFGLVWRRGVGHEGRAADFFTDGSASHMALAKVMVDTSTLVRGQS